MTVDTSIPTATTLLDKLPHGEAFRFVSRVDHCTPGRDGRGTWSLTGDEDFFAGHFPGNPIVPGVLLGEALAQLSGIVAWADRDGGHALLAHLDLKLKRAVAPPVEITLESTVTRTLGQLTQFDVKATVGGAVAAIGSLTLAHADRGEIS